QRRSGGHFISVAECQRSESHDHQHDERAVNPEQIAQEWVERREVRAPVQGSRRERASGENSKMEQSGEAKQCFEVVHGSSFHNAWMACRNGRMTRWING